MWTNRYVGIVCFRVEFTLCLQFEEVSSLYILLYLPTLGNLIIFIKKMKILRYLKTLQYKDDGFSTFCCFDIKKPCVSAVFIQLYILYVNNKQVTFLKTVKLCSFRWRLNFMFLRFVLHGQNKVFCTLSKTKFTEP